jgi:hypothetical protein
MHVEWKTSYVACNDTQNEYRCREDVVRRLLQREMDGSSLRTTVVKVDERPLYVAAIRHFRIWGDALRAAGIDPESVSGKRTWTEERVIRRIRELERQGLMMNVKTVRRVDGGLTQAARRYWGAWANALAAAGLDATTIRRQRPPWTEAEIIHVIQAHAAHGCRVTRNAIQPRSIGKAADRLFGSFEAAVEAAGVAERRNVPPQWSPAKVVAEIQRLAQAGKPINCVTVMRTYQGLYDAARRYHGGWNQALHAAGIDPDSVRAVRRQWTRDSVIDELRRRAANGVRPTCVSSIRPISLVKAARRLFGSWPEALKAAGINRR